MKYLILLTLLLTANSFADNSVAYKAFGEKEGLVKLVDDLWISLRADERMKPFFKNTQEKRFKEKLVEQLCKELDGPCKYTGQNMYRAHKGHSIKRAHFFALVEVLQKVMHGHKIPNWAQNKLLKRLAPMHKEVVNE